MGENININVNKRKKKSIIPFLLVVIIILIGVIGILIYGKTGPQDVENIPEISNPTVDVYSDSENTITEVEKQNEIVNEKVKAIYEEFENATWISKNYVPKVNIFYIEDGKVVCESTGSNKKEVVDLEYGKAKYVYNGLNGGILANIVILSEDGNAYIVELGNATNNDGTYDITELELKKVPFESKVIDILLNADGMFPNSSPYYLTEDGKLYNKEKKTYEEINRNHIAYLGSVDNFVFINENKTLEVLRNNAKNEYLTILDKAGNNIVAKHVFLEISDRWTGTTSNHYYVVDKENRLLDFSAQTIYVANEYLDTKNKVVKDINYNSSKQQIKISFDDGSSITVEDIYQYREVK